MAKNDTEKYKLKIVDANMKVAKDKVNPGVLSVRARRRFKQRCICSVSYQLIDCQDICNI